MVVFARLLLLDEKSKHTHTKRRENGLNFEITNQNKTTKFDHDDDEKK
jgi:hypothetical protein